MFKEKIVRVLLSGWHNFRRNSYVAFGTTGVLALVLILFIGLLGVNFIGGIVVDGLESKVDVSVYFKTEASEGDIATVKHDLESLNTVEHVDYISRDAALVAFKERHAQDALIQQSLAELETNPLQASLNVKATDAGQYASIVSFLETHKLRPTVDKINYYENQAVIGRVQHISQSMQQGGLIATLVLAVIAVLVAFNTVRLTIYNQKQEIEVQRLVGASNWYIRMPYLVEGALYGFCGALIALIVGYAGVGAISPKLALVMPGVSLIGYFTGNGIQIVLLTILGGMALGIISSFIAIRRFLRI